MVGIMEVEIVQQILINNKKMAGPAPSNPQTQVDTSIEQQQLNNFLGPVNGALGGLPVAEKNQEYFIVFQQAGGTGPEIIDQTAYFITYLVDSKGNISKPSEDSISLNNTIQNFEVGKNAIVRNDASTVLNTILTGKKKITAIGRQEPILYSQTGSSEGANINTLDFNTLTDSDTIPRFLFWLNKGALNLNPGENVITNYNPAFQTPESPASIDVINGLYEVGSLASGPESNINRVDITLYAKFSNYTDDVVNGSLRLMRNGSVYGQEFFTIEERVSTTIPKEKEVNFSIPVFTSNLENSSFTASIVLGEDNYVTMDFINFRSSFQSPSTTQPVTNLPFWLNNNGNNLWVTASNEISANYGNIQNSQNVLDVIEPGFNFSPVQVPFNVQIGDKIRFEYSKETEYTVYEVIEPNQDVDGRLKLRLNALVPSSVNLDNFVLHRVNPNDPSYIILDVKKDASIGDTQNFNGVILPEYPTKELKDNLDTILINLKERGIITDNEK